MSVYSTIDLSETETIQLIARHLGIYEYGADLPKTRTQILADILERLTHGNPFTPFRWNNYFVYPDDHPSMQNRIDPMVQLDAFQHLQMLQQLQGQKLSGIIHIH